MCGTCLPLWQRCVIELWKVYSLRRSSAVTWTDHVVNLQVESFRWRCPRLACPEANRHVEKPCVNLVHFPNLSLRFLAFQFGIPGACLVCSTLTAVCSGPLAFFVSSRTPAPRVHLPFLLFSFTPFPRVSPLSPYLFIPFAAFTPGEGRERGKGSCSRDTLVAPLQRFSKWAPGTPNGSLSGFQVVQDKVREVFCF